MQVLLVEDDPINQSLCQSFLRSIGYDVISVTDGEKAWDAVLNLKIDIVISDWKLPGLSGLELCGRLRARKTAEYPYFIMITALQGRSKMDEAMDGGVDDFLTKPIDLDDLRIRLRVAQRILDFHAQINVLKGLLPICMYCKKIRNDESFWETVESYFAAHAGTGFTHSLCPDCYDKRVVPELEALQIAAKPPMP